MNTVINLKNNSKKFNKIVIWGLKNQWHTHRFVFQAYYKVFKKHNIPVIWVDDKKENVSLIEANDLIFTASGMYGKMVPEKKSINDYNFPIRKDLFYCLHAEPDYILEKLDKSQYIQLKYYSNEAEQFTKLHEAVHWDEKTRTLYQPWGTNILPEEFKKPTFNRHSFMFWVGSIWNDKNNHGNIEVIKEFKEILKEERLRFINIRFIPNFLNIFLIRISRIAPAIGGRRQVEINYLPDRMFKNISYGQFGFSNIEKFTDIFKDCSIYNQDTEEMVKKVLALSKEEYLDLIKKQQEICKHYTTENHLDNIFKIF